MSARESIDQASAVCEIHPAMPDLSESLSERSARRRRPGGWTKRSFDILASAVLLMLSLPLVMLIAALVSFDGGPVFFRHERIGWAGKPFGCLKFRTMIPGAESCLDEYLTYHPLARQEWDCRHKLDFDPRITPIGRFLRSTSLDELPQLINVLRGEMSLVGPRPITANELVHYAGSKACYLSMVPGLTGLWQISGRSDLSYPSRVELDRRYAASRTLRLDLWIVLCTPAFVLSRKGAR